MIYVIIMNKILVSAIFLTFSTLPFLLKYLIKGRYKKMIKSLQDDQEDSSYHHCLFINMNNFDCRPHLLQNKECGGNCSLVHESTLLSFIASAKKSICMCIYMMCLKKVIYQLIKAHRRGVDVRVITDTVMLKTSTMSDNFNRLQKASIPYKIQPSSCSLMHHKFCLIDKDDEDLSKMFFGSLNLTTQALCKNFDSIIFTNNPSIITRFSEEFEELWTDFS